jgi:tetratricopeptide (TPR) repeat protein
VENKTAMSFAFKKAFDPAYGKLAKDVRFQVENASDGAALRTATKFYSAYPSDAHANYEYARALVRNDKRALALEHAERANALRPDTPEFVFLLGRLYLDISLYEYAAPLLKQAIDKLPNNILVQWAMADFLVAMGDGKTAVGYYQAALELRPDENQAGELLVSYIKCLDSNGAKIQASEILVKFSKLKQANENSALIMKSNLSKFIPDSDVALDLKKALADPKLSSFTRSQMLLSMGNIQENGGNYDQAFELWTESRKLRDILGEKAIGYKELEETTEFYTPEILQEIAPLGHSSERPLFIVGMPRSGTTLTEQIISSHADAYGVGEMGRMYKLEKTFRDTYKGANSFQRLFQNAKSGELKARAEETLNLLNIVAGATAKRVVDKLPTQYFSMGFTHLCFPNAKFIHCQRHPADSFISAFQNHMSQFHEYSFDQKLYAEAYLTKQALMAHWKESFPDKIFELHYEQLVTHPEQMVREMLDFIGLPWDENCMQFFKNAGTVRTISNDQVRKPIYTSSKARWRKYERHLGPLFEALKEAKFEYPEF